MSIDNMEPRNMQPIFPPDNADDEPTDANPVPLSPTKPERRTSDGATPDTQPGLPIVPVIGGGAGTSGIGAGTPGTGAVGALPLIDGDDRRRADPSTRDD